MWRLLLVCVGSALGGGLRYLVALLAQRVASGRLPYGTLAVNLAGSFLIGLINYVALRGGRMSEETRLLLTTGIMGGLTTYSTFNYETLAYLQTGHHAQALGYLLATVVGCLLLGALGLAAGRALVA